MKQKKKILIIASSDMSLSGVPVVYMSIVRLLRDEYDFDLLITNNKDMHFEKEFLSYGGKILFFDCQKPKGSVKSFFWAIFQFKRKAIKFISTKMDVNEYSCIHAFNGEFSSVLFRRLKRNKKIVKLFHICSAQSAYKRKRGLKEIVWNNLFKGSSKYSDKILFVSKAALDNSEYKHKGVVLYNIFDEEKFGKTTKCKHSSLSLTQIGTFSSRKNQLFSIKIIEKLKAFYPEVQFNIVGRETEPGYLNAMNELIKKKGLSDNVAIMDPSTDRVLLNSNTSFVLYPSLQDSFGLVLIESQACGIHCFASNTMPKDADMGNVDFLPIEEDVWVKKIKDFFEQHGNDRIMPKNIERFTKYTFKKTIVRLYENIN